MTSYYIVRTSTTNKVLSFDLQGSATATSAV